MAINDNVKNNLSAFTGANPDRMKKDLNSMGFSGALNDMYKGYRLATGIDYLKEIGLDFPVPLLFMPLIDNVDILRGIGSTTFTRSTTKNVLNKETGLVTQVEINEPGFESEGCLLEGSSTNEALHNRDFTNAAHIKINITALKDAVGADGVANSASTLTATAANGTVLQTVTKVSAQNTFSLDVRRKTGTGTIEISDDNGVSFTDITSNINNLTYTRFQITTTQANPSIGLRIVTSGDEIEVDYEQLEALPFASSRIETTTAAVTRGSDNLSIDDANIPAPTLAYSVVATVNLIGLGDTGGFGRNLYAVNGESTRRLRPWRNSTNAPRLTHGTTVKPGAVPLVSTQQKYIATSDGVSLNFYIDSIKQGVSAALTAVTGTATNITIGSDAGGNYLFGHIKSFEIYSVELTQNQVVIA